MANSKKPLIGYAASKRGRIVANIVLVLIAVLIAVAIIALVKDKNRNAQNKKPEATADRVPKQVFAGEVLETRYFDVKVTKFYTAYEIKDSIASVYLPPENGFRYLIVEISFKNTDTESKMMPEGEFQIEIAGHDPDIYKTPETMLAKGWGLFMENIEPGKTMTTKLVYKATTQVTGKMYYYPDISYNRDRIFVNSPVDIW